MQSPKSSKEETEIAFVIATTLLLCSQHRHVANDQITRKSIKQTPVTLFLQYDHHSRCTKVVEYRKIKTCFICIAAFGRPGTAFMVCKAALNRVPGKLIIMHVHELSLLTILTKGKTIIQHCRSSRNGWNG